MRKSYKPHHITLFIIASLLVLGAVVYLVPAGRYKILGYEFRFLSEQKLLKENQRRVLNLDSLLAHTDTTIVDDIQEFQPHDEDEEEEYQRKKQEKSSSYELSDADLLTFDETGENNLFDFFVQLNGVGNQKIRILHYGDSQIEGDRITGFLRQRIQSQFGGFGPGFIPAVNVYNTISFEQTHSENFERYTNFGGNQLNGKRYGILNSVGRFTPEYPDSVSIDELEIQTGWITIAPGSKTYARTRAYNKITLHYSDVSTACGFNIYVNDEIVVSDSLIPDGDYHKYRFDVDEDTGAVKFEFTSKISPNILGFALDGESGVQVDNIAMRGSSGTFFGRIDQTLAKQIYDEQNVEMFIMQFGGNAVPYMNDSTAAKNTANNFKGQLNTIKRLRPDAMIIVVGPSDMSTLIEGEYRTYPILPYFVKQLKQATHDVGGAYFDLYTAMGGEDSMATWVDNELAGDDYVHFTNKGSQYAAQKFYDSFMAVFNQLIQ